MSNLPNGRVIVIDGHKFQWRVDGRHSLEGWSAIELRLSIKGPQGAFLGTRLRSHRITQEQIDSQDIAEKHTATFGPKDVETVIRYAIELGWEALGRERFELDEAPMTTDYGPKKQ